MKNKMLTHKLIFVCSLVGFYLGLQTLTYAEAPYQPSFYDPKIWEERDVAIPFDEIIYDLAYQTFLATGNVNNAYLVAKAAVRQKPRNVTWRRHLARTAQWNSKPNIALQNWIFLVKHEHEPVSWQEAFSHALRISKQLGDDPTVVWLMRTQAKRSEYNEEDWVTLIGAQERLGHPEDLIVQLKETLRKKPSKFLQKQLLSLYRHTGQLEAELALLKRMQAEQGMTATLASREAEIYYNQGKIQKAYDILMEVKPNATEADKAYWQTLADLAWLVQNREDSVRAAKHLYHRKEARPRDIMRLITLTRQGSPQHALELAKEGWRQHREDQFFIALLSIGMELTTWNTLNEAFASLTDEERVRLERSPLFWSSRAETWEHLGHPELARNAYENALRQHPHSDLVKADFMWLLLRQQNRANLLQKMHDWQALQENQFMWAPYANAYLYLGKTEKAMKLFEQQWPRHQHDFIWLNQFAYVLDQANQPRAAKTIRNQAWVELKKEIMQQKDNPTIPQMNVYADLTMYQTPGTTAAYSMAYLAAMATLGEASDRETLLNWALGQNYFDLALFWRYRIYQAQTRFPDWAALILAIRHMDLTDVHDVIMRSGHRIPAREQVESTVRLADRALIAQTTYNAMEQTPEDPIVQREMVEVMHDSAHYVGMSMHKARLSLLRATRAQLETAVFPTPNIKVMPYIHQQNQHSSDTTQIVHVPDHDRTLGFKNKFFNRHGYILVDIMHRWALETFTGVSFMNVYRFTSRLNTQFELGYNQNSTGTTPLRIAGAEDKVRFSIDYNITARDVVIASLDRIYFRSQKRRYLGDGYGIDTIYNHKFMFEDPDISVSLIAGAHHYEPANGTAHGELAKIIAPGQVRTFDFFVPDSFRQYGASVQFGQIYKERYTQRMKPFASYGLYYNTLTGTGYNFEVGLASRLFGRDHLVLHFSQGTAQQDAEEEQYIGVDYHYFYS